MACDVLSRGGKVACDLLYRVAKWHVIFCPGWQNSGFPAFLVFPSFFKCAPSFS